MRRIARAFVAVFPPPGVVEELAARLEAVRDRVAVRTADVRWARPEQWHLTLRFLGPVDDVDGLVAQLGPAVAAGPAVTVGLAGAGAFPTPRRASVLWVGVTDGTGLAALAEAVEGACVGAGFAPDDRGFHPHLTVARARRARDLRPLVAAIGPAPIGAPWVVGDVALVASDTAAPGSTYRLVERFAPDSA